MTVAHFDHSRLLEAQAAFALGRYQEARSLARSLTDSREPDVARGAMELLAQLSPAPLGKFLLLLTTLLLVGVTAFAYSR